MARPPKTFASFVGQHRVVETLRRLADGVRGTERTMPHLLLVAAAGLGKTSLGRALAQYAGQYRDDEEPENFRLIQAGRGSLMQVHAVLTSADAGDVIFVDEAHSLGAADAELLYLAVDSNRTMAIDAQGRLDRAKFEAINPMTLVLATNQPGRLPRALETRLLCLSLDPYTQLELRAIAQRVANQFGIELTPQAARVVAQRADGSPRRVEQMLMLIGVLAPRGTKKMSQGQVESALATSLGHNELGLTPLQQRLLALLDRTDTLRAERILNVFGLDPNYVRREIEGPLVTRGLLTITGNHVRQLTDAGRQLMALYVEPDAVHDEDDDDDDELDDDEVED